MDIRTPILELLKSIPQLDQNPHAGMLLDIPEDRLPGAWRLPVAACLAAGGNEAAALPAAASMAAAQLAIILIDDILDEDPRGVYRKIGSGEAANLAVCFQAAAAEILLASSLKATARSEAVQRLAQMFLTTALGQHLDSQNPDTEEGYWHVVQTKSSPFFETAFALGAISAGVTKEEVNLISTFGTIYGEIVQIFDDLHDTMETPANTDWLKGRYPLPLLYATIVEHRQKDRFLALRPRVADEDALQEAQDILISSGAVSYCISELMDRHGNVSRLIKDTPPKNPGPLEHLLEELMGPVRALTEAVGEKGR